MAKIVIIMSSSSGDNPADFITYLPTPLNLTGRWYCKLECLHGSTMQPKRSFPRQIITPFFVCMDFVEESVVNGTLIPFVGMFSGLDWKTNTPNGVYKKCHISFDDHFYPVTKQFLTRVRIRILDRNLNTPKVADEYIFIDITTVKLTLQQDG